MPGRGKLAHRRALPGQTGQGSINGDTETIIAREASAERRKARPGLTRALTLALLLPFVLMSLIAQGNMLARDAGSSRVTVVLCGASLPVSMMIDAQGALVPAPADAPFPKHDASSTCIWAIHGQPGLIAAAPPQAVAAATFRPADLDTAPAQYLRRLGAPVFLARGPPSLA